MQTEVVISMLIFAENDFSIIVLKTIIVPKRALNPYNQLDVISIKFTCCLLGKNVISCHMLMTYFCATTRYYIITKN